MNMSFLFRKEICIQTQKILSININYSKICIIELWGIIVREQKISEILETTTALTWWWALRPGLVFGFVSWFFALCPSCLWLLGAEGMDQSRGTRSRVGHSPKGTEAVSAGGVWFELGRDLTSDLKIRFCFITSALCYPGSSFTTLIISRKIWCH